MASKLTADSPRTTFAFNPKDTTITLFPHQAATVYRMRDIEKKERVGILCDPPGSGKSFCILHWLLQDKRERELTSREKTKNKSAPRYVQKHSLLVVPHNIYGQWIEYIEQYPGLSLYKLVEYRDISELYFKTQLLEEYDLYLTTSTYYQIVAETLKSIDIEMHRLIVDEVDSMTWFTNIQLPNKFTWLVSATAQLTSDGVFKDTFQSSSSSSSETTKKIDPKNKSKATPQAAPPSTIECEESFIAESIKLPPEIVKIYPCYSPYLGLIQVHLHNDTSELVSQVHALNYKTIKLQTNTPITDLESLLVAFNKDALKNLRDLEAKLDMETAFIEKHAANVDWYATKIDELGRKWENMRAACPDLDQRMKHVMQDLKNPGKVIEQRRYELHQLRREIEGTRNPQLWTRIKQLESELVAPEDTIIKVMEQELESLKEKKQLMDTTLIQIKNLKNLLTTLDQYRKEMPDQWTALDALVARMVTIFTSVKGKCGVCWRATNTKKWRCCDTPMCAECVHYVAPADTESNECIVCCARRIRRDHCKVGNEPVERFVESAEKPDALDKSQVVDGILHDFLHKDPATRRLLIFSDFSGTFASFRELLKKLGLAYAEIEGDLKTMLDTIKAYRDGVYQVLLIDSQHYGAGLNLECTTDIILVHHTEKRNQIVGRAQRLGRRNTLTVHELLYDGEGDASDAALQQYLNRQEDTAAAAAPQQQLKEEEPLSIAAEVPVVVEERVVRV